MIYYLKKVLLVIFIFSISTCNSISHSSLNFINSINRGRLRRCLGEIEFLDCSSVTEDLALPEKINGVNIMWSESSHPQYLSVDGVVHRPSFAEGDRIVTILASASIGTTVVNRKFEFIIKSKGHPNEEFKYGDLSIHMVYIPPGSFLLGGVKQVYMTDDFYLGKLEVDKNLFGRVMEGEFKEVVDNTPVTDISWDSIVEFCNRLNLLTGRNFRLPTEAELEYAHSIEGITYVNLFEFTSDRYSDLLVESENPKNPGASGDYFLIKGRPGDLESGEGSGSTRGYIYSADKRDNLGFRLAINY